MIQYLDKKKFNSRPQMLLRCKTWIHAVYLCDLFHLYYSNDTSSRVQIKIKIIATYKRLQRWNKHHPHVCEFVLRIIFKSRKCVLVLSKWFMFSALWKCKHCRFQYQIVQFVYNVNICAMHMHKLFEQNSGKCFEWN